MFKNLIRQTAKFAALRAFEASSVAGLATVVATGAQAWQTRDPQMIGATVAGLAAILIPEKGSKGAPK